MLQKLASVDGTLCRWCCFAVAAGTGVGYNAADKDAARVNSAIGDIRWHRAVVTGGGIALVAWDTFAAALGACLAGASLGFLFHNWAPARVFLGDVGSGVLGFCFASLPLLAPATLRPAAVRFVALSLFFFLADATFTLLARARRGERLHQAHSIRWS